VQQLREVAVRGPGHDQDGDPDPGAGAVRGRVGSRDRPRVEAAREQDVPGDEVVHQRDVAGQRVQRRQVQQVQAADVEQRRDCRVAEQVHRAAAQHPGGTPAGGHRECPEQERHRGGEHERQRGEHAQQQVLDHVRGQVRVPGRLQGWRDGDRDRHEPGQEARRPPSWPPASAGAPQADRIAVCRHRQQDRGRQQPAEDAPAVDAVRERHGRAARRPRASAAPASSSSTPVAFHAMS
jgi:hypothetical protein